MFVGACTLELHLPECRSLKAKRALLRRIQSRLHSRYNVAVAEVGHQDLWQRAVLGVASVSSDRAILDGLFRTLAEEFERHPDAQLLRVHTEIL